MILFEEDGDSSICLENVVNSWSSYIKMKFEVPKSKKVTHVLILSLALWCPARVDLVIIVLLNKLTTQTLTAGA